LTNDCQCDIMWAENMRGDIKLEAWQIVLSFFAGGGVFVAIIGGIREALAFRRQRKAKKEDEKQMNISGRLEKIEAQMSAQSEALKYIMYDRIRYLGQGYIFNGEIDFDDRRILNDMHKSYHYGLGGNGDLDTLMSDVNKLPLKKGK